MSVNLTVDANTTTTHVDLFSKIAGLQEVFGNSKCGKCGSTNLRYVVRDSKDKDGNDLTYFELWCLDCGAKLRFGQHRSGGTLFPKRKDKDGNWIGDKGWVKWNKETNKEE